ncbi:MAG: beta-ketoacyl-ACP synthase II [Bacteroidales bacterium]|nr:beta-ketoacyl-ACP synthase II [Candidatus Cryptobacteroides onthequi]
MNTDRRVVVTGLGVISSIGSDVESFRDSLFAGRCGISRLELPDGPDAEGIRVRVASQVKDFVPASFGLTPQEARKSDRFSQFAVAASLQALQSSGLRVGENIDPEMLGVYMATGIGGLETFVRQTKNMVENGSGMISPLFIPMMIANIGGANVAIKVGAQGPCLTAVSACASGTNSIGEAFLAVKRGDADAIIAGGSEAAVSELAIGGFQSARALSLEEDPLKACLPFDMRRSGFVMGEGAGALMLEEYEHAVARGARIYAEICGYGNTCDAHHVTAPAPDGKPASRAMRRALDQAGYRDDETLYINAHGTGTHLNDKSETLAIKLALGEEQARRAVISSTKSMTGHMLGAAGAVEAVACVLALEYGTVPPTIGLAEPDPECDLDYVPGVARRMDIDVAMSDSLGFGGHNAAIVLRRTR